MYIEKNRRIITMNIMRLLQRQLCTFQLNPLRFHSRVIIAALSSRSSSSLSSRRQRAQVCCAMQFISQIKDFRVSNQDKGIILAGNAVRSNVYEKGRTIGCRGIIIFLMTFSGSRKAGVFRTRTHALTLLRLFVRLTRNKAWRVVEPLFLPLYISLVNSFTIVAATQQAGSNK